MLSSLEGSAVTDIKIEGVMHEFQKIDGVVEDVTEIILNLKKLVLKKHCEGDVVLHLKADSEGEVHASDIEKNGDVPVEIALQYTTAYSENIYSFVNNINTIEGGTHLEGFKRALTKTFNDYAKAHNILKEKDANLQGEDIREGITAVVSDAVSVTATVKTSVTVSSGSGFKIG